MKNLKKAAAMLIALIMLMLPLTVSASASYGGPLTFSVSGNGYKVTSCLKTASGKVEIPSTYEGKSVTGISSTAFENCVQITEIVIPATVTSVDTYAFSSLQLETVIFEGASCKIAKGAFSGCRRLANITLPSGLTTIYPELFENCTSLKNVEIPSTVTYISNEAFAGSGLTSVNIPASVESMGEAVFMACESVSAFTVESGNPSYKAVGGALYTADGKTFLQYPCAKTATSFAVPSGTEIIGMGAFASSNKLKKVTLPEGVSEIGKYAFYNNALLETVTLPSTLEIIGSMAFSNCPKLKTVTIPAGISQYEGAFYQSGLTSVVIAEGVELIDATAFEGCTNLTSVTIPSTVTTIGNRAFDGCTALKTLEIPASVTDISSSNPFLNCTNLTLIVSKGSAAHTYAVEKGLDFDFAKSVAKIEITTLPSKTVFNYKQEIDTSGMEITVTYTDNTTAKKTSGFTVTPGSFNSVGTKTVTVNYEGCTDTYTVNVSYSVIQWIIRIFLLGFLWM